MLTRDRGLPADDRADDRKDKRFEAFCARASGAAAALVFLAGVLNLFLWFFDRTLLWKISLHGVVLTPTTALAFILSGVSLWCGREKADGRIAGSVADACAFVAGSFGVLTLGGYLSGQDLLTGPLFGRAISGNAAAFTWQMSPHSALFFLFLGLSMLLGRRRACGAVPAYLAVAAGLISLLAVTAYAYDAEQFLNIGNLKLIAFHSALVGLILSAGTILSMEDRGLAAFLSLERAGSIMARVGLPAVILLPVLFGFLRHWGAERGLFGEGAGIWLMVVFGVGALAALLLRDAARLNRFDRERERTDRLRERHERALAGTAAVLDKVFSNIHLQIAYMDARFHFLKVNQGYAEGAGYPAEFFVGRNHFDLFPHEENEKIFRKVVETGEPFAIFSKPFEFPDQPERGTTYWDWSLQPVKEADGAVTGLIFSLIDVTERVRAERQLRKQEELAVQQEKMAILGQMAAGIAHEIRNPLSGLGLSLGAAQSACEEAGELEPEARERLARAIASSRAAAGKIGEVVRRVMDFARPGSIRMKPVDVNEAVRDAVAMISPMLRKSGIRIETALSADLPACMADLRLIEQLVLNLVDNAAQAVAGRPEGEKRIEISSRREERGVVIAVADSGQGVPETLRGRIFEPFFTTRPEGTGLGLAISRRIVSDHGGSLEIGRSRLGGADFRVLLPAAEGFRQGQGDMGP